MDDQSKIFVVVAVLSVILLGIGFYLNSLDRKVKKLEDEINKEQ
ncbi:MAG: CcmD family protein [Bacteroidales bacterium]|nr:CcmD family protein [Bacteroidales bacterium]